MSTDDQLDPQRDHWLIIVKNLQPIIFGLVTVVVSIGGSWMSTEYRIQTIEDELARRQVVVDAYPSMRLQLETQSILQQNQTKVQTELARSLNITTEKLQTVAEKLTGVAARMDEQSRQRNR